MFTGLIAQVEQGTVSQLTAKDILKTIIDTGKDALKIINEQGLAQLSDDSILETIVSQILQDNPNVIVQIKEGKDSARGFLVGQAMKRSKGKANPKKVGEMIQRRLLRTY